MDEWGFGDGGWGWGLGIGDYLGLTMREYELNENTI